LRGAKTGAARAGGIVGDGLGEASLQCGSVIPWHPVRWVIGELVGMALQFGEIVEGIHVIQLAAVNQAHI
jgi:hypothetical protein